jgi:hypothetical protein
MSSSSPRHTWRERSAIANTLSRQRCATKLGSLNASQENDPQRGRARLAREVEASNDPAMLDDAVRKIAERQCCSEAFRAVRRLSEIFRDYRMVRPDRCPIYQRRAVFGQMRAKSQESRGSGDSKKSPEALKGRTGRAAPHGWRISSAIDETSLHNGPPSLWTSKWSESPGN